MPERYSTGMSLVQSHIHRLALIAVALGCLVTRTSAQSLAADDSSSAATASTDQSSIGPVAPGAPNSPAISGQAQPSAASSSTTSTGPSLEGTSASAGISAAPISGPGATTPGTTGGAFHGGPIPFHVTVSIGESYDDNIFIQPNKVSDFITSISLKAEFQYGTREGADTNFLELYYQPTGEIYEQHSKEDSLNHNVDLFYQHRFSKLTLDLEQSYVHAQSSNAAIGNLITSDVYNTIASANYAYSDKFDVRGTFTQNFTDFQNPGYTSSREWDGDLYFLYHLDDRLSIGIGPRFGFLDVQEAPNQTFQQLLGHLTYVYSDKLNFAVAGGAEYREYENDVRSNTLSPVFELSGTYRPSQFTSVTLSGARHYMPSYNFIGQDYISTNVGLSVSQQFYQKFSLGLSVGFENDDYEAAGPSNVATTREDNYFYTSPTVAWHPNDWLVVNAYYRYQRDDSSFDAYSFNDNQVGISLSATY
jgi:hypothetical protein